MFAAIFKRRDPQLSALEAVRRMVVNQIHGSAGADLARIRDQETRIWSRLMNSFDIRPEQGLLANRPQIEALAAACRAHAARFDYFGVIASTLPYNAGFPAEEREAMIQYVAGLASQPAHRGRLPAEAMRPGYRSQPIRVTA